jgi:hypothetical protein
MKKWNATITHHSHDSCAVAQLTPGRECHGEQVKTYTYTQGWSTGTPKDVSSFFKNGTGGRVRGVARGLGSPSRAACVSQGAGADARRGAGEECKKQNKGIACENLSPATEFSKATSKANKLELGSSMVDVSQGVLLGEYVLPADMVRNLANATDVNVKPSCETPAAARRMGNELVSCDISRANSRGACQEPRGPMRGPMRRACARCRAIGGA